MRGMALLTLLGVTFAFLAMAQEETDPPADDNAATEAAEPLDDEDAADDPVVDDEFYQDADDQDFRPSEDIPADQSIPFPTDI